MNPARAGIVAGGILMLIVGIAHMFFHRIEELPGRRPLEAGPGPVGAARSPGGAAS